MKTKEKEKEKFSGFLPWDIWYCPYCDQDTLHKEGGYCIVCGKDFDGNEEGK